MSTEEGYEMPSVPNPALQLHIPPPTKSLVEELVFHTLLVQNPRFEIEIWEIL